MSKSIPSSGTFSEVRVALDCALYPLFQTHHRFVAQILFGSVTAVIVVRSSKRHSHWCKSGFEGQYWAKDQGQKPQQQGQSIHQNVREVESRGGVTKSHQHFRHEVPESNWLVVGDMVRLKKGIEDVVNLFKNSTCNLNTRRLTPPWSFFLTFPHMGEFGLRFSAARMWPWTTFSTKVKSTRLVPSLEKVELLFRKANTKITSLQKYLETNRSFWPPRFI